MAPYKENHKVNETISNVFNSRCIAKLVAHFTWLFLVTPSDRRWDRTSKYSSVEVVL